MRVWGHQGTCLMHQGSGLLGYAPASWPSIAHLACAWLLAFHVHLLVYIWGRGVADAFYLVGWGVFTLLELGRRRVGLAIFQLLVGVMGATTAAEGHAHHCIQGPLLSVQAMKREGIRKPCMGPALASLMGSGVLPE